MASTHGSSHASTSASANPPPPAASRNAQLPKPNPDALHWSTSPQYPRDPKKLRRFFPFVQLIRFALLKPNFRLGRVGVDPAAVRVAENFSAEEIWECWASHVTGAGCWLLPALYDDRVKRGDGSLALELPDDLPLLRPDDLTNGVYAVGGDAHEQPKVIISVYGGKSASENGYPPVDRDQLRETLEDLSWDQETTERCLKRPQQRGTAGQTYRCHLSDEYQRQQLAKGHVCKIGENRHKFNTLFPFSISNSNINTAYETKFCEGMLAISESLMIQIAASYQNSIWRAAAGTIMANRGLADAYKPPPAAQIPLQTQIGLDDPERLDAKAVYIDTGALVSLISCWRFRLTPPSPC